MLSTTIANNHIDLNKMINYNINKKHKIISNLESRSIENILLANRM